MPLHIEETLRAHVSNVEVVRLYRGDEVFIRWHYRGIGVFVRVDSLVRRDKAEPVALAEHHGGLFGLDFPNRLLLRIPAIGLASDCVVSCRILLVLR